MSSEEEAVAAWSAGKRWSPFRHRDELPVEAREGGHGRRDVLQR